MRRALVRVLAVALVIVGLSILQLHGHAQKIRLGAPAQALFRPGTNTATEKLQATTDNPIDESSPALRAVAQFLELRTDQIDALLRLLDARRSALTPLLENITTREKQLSGLLGSGGAPADVGQLVIQIHALEQQVAFVQQNFLANFENLLDPEQRQRVETVRIAAQLQPIVPAFQQLALL